MQLQRRLGDRPGLLAGGLILGIVAVVLLVALLMRGSDVKALVHQALDLLRSAGPVPFFICMALLPAAGAPLSLFTLSAGSAFAPTMGMAAVIALALAAIAINIALSYALALRLLRPVLESILRSMGYRLPELRGADATEMILLLRLTPGMPFPVQNYLLGLGRAPFVRYLVLSCLVAFPLNIAFILLGEALVQGRGRIALLAVLLLLAVMVAINLVRRRLRERQAAGEVARRDTSGV